MECADEHNQADGSLYVVGRCGGGYLRILNPEPGQWLDVPSGAILGLGKEWRGRGG